MTEIDGTAARLQLEELQSRWQDLQDNKLALQLFLLDSASETLPDDFDVQLADMFDTCEEQQLQEQIASLSSFITVVEDQQVALNSIAEEEAQQAASLQLATALEAQEQWEASVLRPHDAALARAIAGCNARDWRERGELLEHPMDLSGRPGELDALESASAAVDAGCSHKCARLAATTSDALTNSGSGASGNNGHISFGCGAGISGQQGRLDCGICFESHPAGRMLSASLPAAMASSSHAAGRCGHHYCFACMQQYISCEIQARKVPPVCCPHPECDEELADADVARLLKDQPQLLQVYQALEAEQLIDLERRVYCPYKDCSTLLERPDQQDGQAAAAADEQEAPFECPVCHRSFCLTCGIAGWHTGMTCSTFQALPPQNRSAEDAAMLHIAREKKWKRCPSCRHVVERSHGCNHMKCRCGCHFCYACGEKYISAKPSATNVHGTQGCSCDLFLVPEEPHQQQEAAAVVLAQAVVRPRPRRSGRKISRTRCRHSDSIHDCPYGPGRCTFWHDEDDDKHVL